MDIQVIALISLGVVCLTTVIIYIIRVYFACKISISKCCNFEKDESGACRFSCTHTERDVASEKQTIRMPQLPIPAILGGGRLDDSPDNKVPEYHQNHITLKLPDHGEIIGRDRSRSKDTFVGVTESL